MDLTELNSRIQGMRYQSAILTAPTMQRVVSLSNEMTAHFDNFEHWNNPETEPAPAEDISPDHYCRLALESDSRTGLIISEPEQWFYHWTPPRINQLWSGLAESYNSYPVIIITKQSIENMNMPRYFIMEHNFNDGVRLWLSRFEFDQL
ncbi:hypothetical protein D5085_04225 [Ectothiorhodospiraceae bacterium BW-2]|nr:hypothetical protein D5085_04225 [Ectothiorhodospiraceae bacterium BW-2]